MNNISHIKDCYGCGVCATACPRKIISIELNDSGFYEPRIQDEDACVNCGICLRVCAFSHSERAVPEAETIRSYAAWSNDAATRQKCSSGGAGFEIARLLLKQGYQFCGVRYNVEKERAEHYIAETEEEAAASIGSKYIQSYTLDGFRGINRKQKYLVTGTPCQIDSFRRYIRLMNIEKNFILMDFFCHSVPSMQVWNKYCRMVEKETGKISHVSWRDKRTGWHDSWAMHIQGQRGDVEQAPLHDEQGKTGDYHSRLSRGDVFYRLFLWDFCINKACMKNCKYKMDASSADIRIGDLWGKTYKKDEKGVSALITFSSQGDDVVRNLNSCTIEEHPLKVVTEGQMNKNASKACFNAIAAAMIRSKKIHHVHTWNILFSLEKAARLPKRIIRKIKRILFS